MQRLTFAWKAGVDVLSIPALHIKSGEKLFLKGPSGSGKSTLLGVIAGVFAPTSGHVKILGQPFHQLSAAARDRVRADAIGVIFQQFNLVPYLNLTENVLLPCRFSASRAARVGNSETERTEKSEDLLSRLGLGDEVRDARSAAELSVGQQQRVAAARALIGSPSLVIADEPTSALDAETRDTFIGTLLAEAGDAAVLFVSHDAALARHFDRVLSLNDINDPQTDVIPTPSTKPQTHAETT
ncbi:MAG: ABC transporter ATP-binding protein [Pseudomonadota bacterium]